jgi:hypothetical protein
MINKRFEITAATINAGTAIESDVEITKIIPAINGDTDTRYLYPQQLQVINDCGGNIEWLSLSSIEEYEEYTDNPSLFTFVRLPNGYSLQDDFTSFGRCYKFIIKLYSGTATSDLTLEFINYRNSLK